MKELHTCRKEGEQIAKKYTDLFGNLIVNGLVYLKEVINKATFLHHEHIHLPYNFHFRKNHFLCQSKRLVKQMADSI